MKDDATNPVMERARALFEKSGKTLEELGILMGYGG